MKVPAVHRDPSILGGAPVFVGTRVLAQTLIDYIEAGDTIDRFLDHFPSVSREQVKDFIHHDRHPDDV